MKFMPASQEFEKGVEKAKQDTEGLVSLPLGNLQEITTPLIVGTVRELEADYTMSISKNLKEEEREYWRQRMRFCYGYIAEIARISSATKKPEREKFKLFEAEAEVTRYLAELDGVNWDNQRTTEKLHV
jgi:hypothetical protein